MALDCSEDVLLLEYRAICEHVVNMGVAVMYVMANYLLDYDTLDNLVPETEAHLDSRLAVVMEDVVNRFNTNTKLTQMLGFSVQIALSGEQPADSCDVCASELLGNHRKKPLSSSTTTRVSSHSQHGQDCRQCWRPMHQPRPTTMIASTLLVRL